MPKKTLLAVLTATAMAPAFADDLANRLAVAETRLAALEQQNSVAERVHINGFMTFGMERTNTIRGTVVDPMGAPIADQPISYQNSDTDWNLRSLSRAGIRITTDINERTSAVVQLLSQGDDDYNTEVQWAYVAYELTPGLTWRAGRLVLPTYMHSQYTKAGYAYPWIELPAQVYGTLPIDTMEGMDLTWSFNTGNVSHTANITWGAVDLETATGSYQVKNQTGVNLTSRWQDWSSRVSYSIGQTTLALPDLTPGPNLAPFGLDDEFGYFASIGGQYDNGQWLLMAELVRLGVNAPANWFPTQTAGYITTGYRIGRLLPHLTWSTVDSDDSSECSADPVACGSLASSNAVRSKSWTLGARYDLSTGIALKAEASRFYDFSNDEVTNAALFSGLPTSSNPTVFRLAVEAAF